MVEFRELVFLARSRKDLASFPLNAQQDALRQLRRVQEGIEPSDWKPMKSIGAGVNEIRIRDQSGAYRVIYVAKLKEAVYVIHCFEKKSQKTSRPDLELAARRYKQLVRGSTGP